MKDIQNERDSRSLDINRVGISSLRIPIRVRGRDGNIQATIAEFQLGVFLSSEYRGTHMSRFVEVLNANERCFDYESLETLAYQLLEVLETQEVEVRLKFPYFMEKMTPVTEKKSWLDYDVGFKITASNQDKIDLVTTVEVQVKTLCPCSKEISQYGAHNQRSRVKFDFRLDPKDPFWIEEAIQLVEASGSSELFSLLKRQDEKYVTEVAFQNPVFVEDLVRNVAFKAQKINRIKWYRIEAENFESIHTHNAYAFIENNLS